MNILITGSNGLIGSTASNFFLKKGHSIIGIDNNMRNVFFGKEGSTIFQRKELLKNNSYKHYSIDIRNKNKIFELFEKNKIDAVIHTAAQPSHDKAKEIPLLDFEVNTLGTLNLLEATRIFHSRIPFIFTSTNKVYGDNPNKISIRENKTRFTYKQNKFGIDESLSIDQNLHSLFGASKTAADLYVQEYGRYFNMKTTVLRLGCITGISHASTKLHGFLSYLIKSMVHDNKYEVIGYKGKQVRDQLDASDLSSAFEQIIKNPSRGEVFNLGGGPNNNASIKELISIISKKLNTKPKISYKSKARVGDHICYISDIRKFSKYYPKWKIKKNLNQIIDEIIEYEKNKKHFNSRG